MKMTLALFIINAVAYALVSTWIIAKNKRLLQICTDSILHSTWRIFMQATCFVFVEDSLFNVYLPEAFALFGFTLPPIVYQVTFAILHFSNNSLIQDKLHTTVQVIHTFIASFYIIGVYTPVVTLCLHTIHNSLALMVKYYVLKYLNSKDRKEKLDKSKNFSDQIAKMIEESANA